MVPGQNYDIIAICGTAAHHTWHDMHLHQNDGDSQVYISIVISDTTTAIAVGRFIACVTGRQSGRQ